MESNRDSLPQICDEIGRLIENVGSKRRRQVSLKTAAILINGTAKLYRQELNKLLEDVMKLDNDIIFRRRASNDDDSTKESSKSTTSTSTQTADDMVCHFEKMKHQCDDIQRYSENIADAMDKLMNNNIAWLHSSETEPTQNSQCEIGHNATIEPELEDPENPEDPEITGR